MNRVIKFRAWGRALGDDTNSMSEPFDLLTVCNECGTFDGPSGIDMHSDHTLMQYTGLKDKNGREIYEGDIVQTTWDFTSGQQSKAKVVIEHLTCGIRWLPPLVEPDDLGFKPLYDASNHIGNDDAVLDWDLGQFEIIGNIYENPELLNDKQD